MKKNCPGTLNYYTTYGLTLNLIQELVTEFWNCFKEEAQIIGQEEYFHIRIISPIDTILPRAAEPWKFLRIGQRDTK